MSLFLIFFFNDTATTEIYTLSLHDALPILAHFAAIYDRVDQPERLGVCLDTAHFFAAGYDIRTPKGWDAAIAEVDSAIGLKQILAFHLNDSKADLASRVDRHAHIGQGKIGKDAFRHIVNDPRF